MMKKNPINGRAKIIPVFICITAVWCSLAGEPMTKLKAPNQNLPENLSSDGWRLTVEPLAGYFVLATCSVYEGIEVATKDSAPISQVTRLIKTSGKSVSEVIMVRCTWVTRQTDEDRFNQECLVSGFGQNLLIRELDFDSESGASTTVGAIDNNSRPVLSLRRIRFCDPKGDPAKTKIIEFELKVIEKTEAEALSSRFAVPLPDENTSDWTITLPQHDFAS